MPGTDASEPEHKSKIFKSVVNTLLPTYYQEKDILWVEYLEHVPPNQQVTYFAYDESKRELYYNYMIGTLLKNMQPASVLLLLIL